MAMLRDMIIRVVKAPFVLKDNIVWGAVSWFVCHRLNCEITRVNKEW